MNKGTKPKTGLDMPNCQALDMPDAKHGCLIHCCLKLREGMHQDQKRPLGN